MQVKLPRQTVIAEGCEGKFRAGRTIRLGMN